MDRRRMMSGTRKPLLIFKYGDGALSAGAFGKNNWNGKPKFYNGSIITAAEHYEDDLYYRGAGSIFGIDFSGYKKLCFKISIPLFGSGFKIGIGIGPQGQTTNSYFEKEEWTRSQMFYTTGEYEKEIDIADIEGECPITLWAEGALSRLQLSTLYVYDMWLE